MAKTSKVYDRSYDDRNGAVEILDGDETVAAFNVREMAGIGPDQEVTPGLSSILKGAARYFGDIVTGKLSAAGKAEGATPESIKAKALETIKALTDGTFTYRAASGSASLSVSEEQAIIAGELVNMGRYPDKETALAKVVAAYNATTTAANGNVQRLKYNKLRSVGAIKAALEKAKGGASEQSKLDEALKDD